jgi:Bacterial capsule synthesis protein PGA_cap
LEVMNSPSVPHLVVNSSGQPDRTEESTLLFAGDFYLRAGHSLQDHIDLFDPAIMGLVQQSTFSIVNFEGTIPTADSQAIHKAGPHLAIDQRGPALLKSVGFRGITLANNHAMDYGVEALRRTLQLCANCGLSHVGAAFNSVEARQPLKVLLPGNVRLQVLSFCEREFGVSVGNRPGTACLTSPEAEDAVVQAKQEGDVVIVCTHGGNEFMPLPSPQRRQQLRCLIDAGADLIIGHHPHVPQAWEQYQGRYIFYSLGDFYFDSTDGRRYEYRDWGFTVRVHLEGRRIKTLEIVPYERVQDQVVVLGSRQNAASRLSYLEQLSSILAGSEFEGYWQQLAVNRLSAYRSFLRGASAYSHLSFRGRLREILRMGCELGNLLRFTKPPHSLTDRSRRQALGLLNVIRCDSHRWAIETALAVLTGECEDLRSEKIKDRLTQMAPIYGEGVL